MSGSACACTDDLLLLRWRTAQWMLACHDDDAAQAAVLRAVMAVERLDPGDVLDEFALLLGQFGHRSRFHVAAEAERLAARLVGAR